MVITANGPKPTIFPENKHRVHQRNVARAPYEFAQYTTEAFGGSLSTLIHFLRAEWAKETI